MPIACSHPGLRDGVRIAAILFVSAMTGAFSPALAQTSGASAADVGQQQIRNQQDRAEALSAAATLPGIAIPPQIADVPLTPAQQAIVVPVAAVEVEGSTVYDAAALAPLLQPSLGRPNTLVELRALAARLAERYRADGYPFTTVQLPGQQVSGGRVRLRVSEFRVTSVVFDLDGQEVAPPAALQPAIAAILSERPVRLATLEAAAARAASLPDIRIATTRTDRTRDGDLRLTVYLARPGAGVVAIQPPSARGGAGEEQRIAVRGVRIVGNTALPAADLVPETASVVGREVSLAELRASARLIAERYAAAGFFGTTASVPPQIVRDGIVTVEVTELAIGQVTTSVNGRVLPADDLLSRAASAAAANRPATVADVQRQLYILSNIPGTRIESVIPPVADDPTAQIYLRRSPITLTSALDNRGTNVAGELQAGAMITTNGLFGLNEQLQFQALTSFPTGEVGYLGGVAIVPLTSSGLIGTFSISRSQARPGGYLAPVNAAALGDLYSFGLSYPVIARADLSSLLTLSFDVFNNTSSIHRGEIRTSDERSRAIRLGTTTTVNDRLGGTSTIRLVFSRGIVGLGARPNSRQVNTRPGLELDASKVLLEVGRTQPLPHGFLLSASVLAQRASGPLPAAEVMTFGGVNYGRAFDSGIITGDHGIAGKVSLSRPTPLGNPYLPLVDPFVFFDIGETYSAQRRLGVSSSRSAASTGVGLRFVTGLGLGGSIEVDRGLTRQPTVEIGRTARPLRVFFLLFVQV